jgi:hypothetical protein
VYRNLLYLLHPRRFRRYGRPSLGAGKQIWSSIGYGHGQMRNGLFAVLPFENVSQLVIVNHVPDHPRLFFPLHPHVFVSCGLQFVF